ncbi:unnamed protein product, partial [Adineta ricciae]
MNVFAINDDHIYIYYEHIAQNYDNGVSQQTDTKKYKRSLRQKRFPVNSPMNIMNRALCFLFLCLSSHNSGNNGNGNINNGNNLTSNQHHNFGMLYNWSLGRNISTSARKVNETCVSLFVVSDTIVYCSAWTQHKVVNISLSPHSEQSGVVAGNGQNGSTANMLNFPWGIFIHNNSHLYIADSGNDRIQRFTLGNNSGETVVGSSASGTILLSAPTGVTLDADENLYIVDSGNHRIIRKGSNGFQCLIGCGNRSGSQLDQLARPISMSFDSYGNMFVVDMGNSRIEKFHLTTNSCDTKTAMTTPTMTSQIGETIHVTQISNKSLHHSTTTINKQRSNITVATVRDDSSRISTDQNDAFTTKTNLSTEKTASTTNTTSTVSRTSITALTTFPTPFVPSTCVNTISNSFSCDKLKSSCHMKEPCRNNGTCTDNSASVLGYTCTCPIYFNGSQCENDHQPCKRNTCLNHGTVQDFKRHGKLISRSLGSCAISSNQTFRCTCQRGWQGDHCEIKINHCGKCQNNAVCRPLLNGYKCECIGNYYSGTHCEIPSTKVKVYQMISKSFGYVGIIAIASVVLFVVIMDVLKYCFGIDPTREELIRYRREKRARKRQPVIQRFV